MHVSPALFPHAAWRAAAPGRVADVATPLGALATSARVDDHLLVPDAAAAFDGAGAARLWAWEGGVFRAELLRARIPSARADAEGDVGCEVALWRLHASERPAECQLRCQMPATAPPRREEGGWRWRADGWCVHVQAEAGEGTVHEEPDGLVVSAPMERGARVTARFVVGWWRERDGHAPQALAVDWTPERLLAALSPGAR